MNFREWVLDVTPDFFESRFGGKPGNPDRELNRSLKAMRIEYQHLGQMKTAKQLAFSPDKDKYKEEIENYILGTERWSGNSTQFVNSMRHNFTNYDKQMDILKAIAQDSPRTISAQFPDGCRKLSTRIRFAKQTYELVDGIITNLAPSNLNATTAKTANYGWLKGAIEKYIQENESLKQMAAQYWPNEKWTGCPPETFVIPPPIQSPVAPVTPALQPTA